MGVEDLRQRHTLIEQDIAVHGERVKALEAMSEKFMKPIEDGTFLWFFDCDVIIYSALRTVQIIWLAILLLSRTEEITFVRRMTIY